jgi:chromosome partitioning protein
MRSIGLWQAKGGTGKTTTTINLAVGLARRGYRTLAIDADPQANLSMVLLQGEPAAPPTLGEVLLNQADAAEAIRPTHVEGLDVLPAGDALADVNLALAPEWGRERRLRVALEGVEPAYDFIVADTSPAQSLVNVNVLNWAGELLVPVDPRLFSLSGLARLRGDVEQVRRFLDNRRLRIGGIVLTRVQVTNLSRDVERQLRELFGPLVHRATIPTSTKVEEAHSRYQAVTDYAPRSPGAKAYDALIGEILADDRRTQDGAGDAAGRVAEADSAA